MPPDDPLLVRKTSHRIPRTALREFLNELTRGIARGREITCLLTGDRELRKLNREFRGKDYVTDVLSFPSHNHALRRDSMERVPLNSEGNRAVDSGAQFNQSTREDNRAASPLNPHPLGEIAISLDRAAAQAAEYGHSLADELRILMLHGALHLAGYDHENDSGEMARAELRWRKRFGLPIALIERAAVHTATP